MFVRLFLLLMIVPIVELVVVLKVYGLLAEHYGSRAGLLVTIGAILGTGVLGATLARAQGLGVVRQLQRSMVEGRSPGRPLIDGVMVLAGGVLLLVPGFVTDIVGLSLLVPGIRALYRRGLSRWLAWKISQGEAFVRVGPGPGPGPGSFGPGSVGNAGPARGRVIDVTPDDRDRP